MAELAQGRRAYVIIGLIIALSALAGLFTLPPLDRDESRFAQATAQMLETGNFVEINFLDTERNKKPIGIHWLQVVTVGAFSDAEARDIWAYRIPSMLGAILAAFAFTAAGTARYPLPAFPLLGNSIIVPAIQPPSAVSITPRCG